MNSIKKLAGQTAIYGASSIVGRLLNYLLTPLHTSQFATDQYGIITEMYAYVAFLVVLLTYGMETAFFRFSSKYETEKNNVFSTSLITLLLSSAVFILTAITFKQGIADWLRYPNNSEYVVWFAVIVGFDAISSLPLARLRNENKPVQFAGINLLNVGVNIGLNIFFIGYCMPMYESGHTNTLIDWAYNPEIGVGYVFIANLIASIIKLVALSPVMLSIRLMWNASLLKKMLWFGLPLLIAGLAGIVNETLDRILLKRLLYPVLGEKETLSQLGIYGANYKISIIITLFIQAFRYAAEPFFFSQEKSKNAKETYREVMTYFVAVVGLIFLGVMLFQDFIKYFIPNEAYWSGLHVVPILLLANIFLGIYYNQSIWYKLTEKTYYGAIIAAIGAFITLLLNLLLIPVFGYLGSAWATLACYASMVLLSFWLGQRHYPIRYEYGKIFTFLTTGVGLWVVYSLLPELATWLNWTVRILFIVLYFIVFVIFEKPIEKWKQSKSQ